MAKTSTWLIGSYADLAAQDVTIGASAETLTPAYDGLYLYHATAGLSIVAQFELLMDNSLTNATCRLGEDGLVRLTADGAFTVTWTDTLLRDLLGFTGNLGSATSHTAPNQSPLLWRSSRTYSSMQAPLGADGVEVFDQSAAVSPDARQKVTSFGTNKVNELVFTYVDQTKYWKPGTDDNKEYHSTYVYWLGKGWHFTYANVTEDEAGTDDASISGELGPYALDVTKAPAKFPMKRSSGLEMVECSYDVTIPILKVSEYEAV